MAGFLETFSDFEMKKNEAVSAFTSTAQKQIQAFDEGRTNNRSWVKEDGIGFVVKLGKLDRQYRFPNKEMASDFLRKAIDAAHTDNDFRSMIEEAYGSKPSDEPKPKRKYTRRSAAA